MDRSFLSDQTVIDASRRFVCIRMATYENAEEADVLKSIFIGRSGELENTTFAVLSPNGGRELIRGGRSPKRRFRSPADLAGRLVEIADRYDPKKNARPLPGMKTVRLSLNVAACDNRPLVIGYAKDENAATALTRTLARLAWTDRFIGRAEWVVTTSAKDLRAVGLKPTPGIHVVQPDPFGTRASLLVKVDAGAAAKVISAALDKGIKAHQTSAKSTRAHVRKGRGAGLDWKTAIPVTDPGGRRRGR